MENTRLKTFRVVAEMSSFRKAALELHLTQPAVTAQIKALEETLGVAVFSRAGRNISLTPAGSTLLTYTRKIEKLTNEAVAALTSFGAEEKIEINVGASYTIGVYLLPKLLPLLLQSWPQLHIHMTVGSTSEILHALTSYRISLGMIEGPAYRPDLKIEPFGRDELTLVAPSGHRWAARKSITPGELVQEPILLREAGSGMRRSVEEFLEKHGVRSQLRSTMDMNSTEAIVAAVEAGAGIGFISSLALEKVLMSGSIKVIPIEGAPILRWLSLVLHKGPEPQGPIRELVGLLRQASTSPPHSVELVSKTRESLMKLTGTSTPIISVP